ncbi:hypothetical protein [Microbacterium sp. CPCC 204701]|uniref:hypothetical protein n=1 Tax=Microbacterium sp. CPCC 204701 TaxID=2493084 RepID=UPI0013E3573E|nr:hypothetical protein [Microbacterium sp. CPCC 204701]
MTATTSSTPLARRETSPKAALLLTVAGNILVIVIGSLTFVGVGVAAIAVFGPQLIAAL